MLKAGVGQVDISPKLGVQLAGFPHCTRENTGVHDPIYAKAIHLDTGKDKITTVFIDALYIAKNICAEIRREFNYPITFTCTHTHCAPWLTEPSQPAYGHKKDPEYIKETTEKIINLIKEAESNTFDAEIATATGHCGAEQGVGGNRREKGGICDPSVNVISVREKGGDIRGIMVNYSLHPTFLHAENTLVTADYPAYIGRYFHFAEPKAIVMFAQGTSGNQSSRYHRVGQDFDEAARVGTTIAIEAARVINEATFTDEVNLSFKSFTIDNLPLKVYPAPEVAKKLKEEAEAYYESVKHLDYITARNAELAMFGAQNNYQYSLADNGSKSPELPMEVVAITINDTLIVQFQGEQFVEYGLYVKELSSYDKTFVFEVSNGALPGYIYTEKAGEEGGYEVGSSKFAQNVETVLKADIKEIMENV